MSMKYIKVYYDFNEVTAQLSDAEKGRLIGAMVAYASGKEEEVKLSGAEKYLYPLLRAQIDRDAATYADISSKRREAGAKGGKQKQANSSKNKQMLANGSKNKQDKDKDQDEDKDYSPSDEGESEAKASPRAHACECFVPPSVEEVQRYISAQGLAMDAEAFVDYYTSNGWRTSKGPMEDWTAAARGWARREKQYAKERKTAGKPNRFNSFEQRDEDFGKMEDMIFGW